MVRFDELLQYKNERGNTLAPQGYEIIRNWAFGFVLRGIGRIQKLNEVGFSWDGKEALRLEQYDPQWSERFDELLQYAKEQGNALVPHKYKSESAIGILFTHSGSNTKTISFLLSVHTN